MTLVILKLVKPLILYYWQWQQRRCHKLKTRYCFLGKPNVSPFPLFQQVHDKEIIKVDITRNAHQFVESFSSIQNFTDI